jgi:hypothetical protein
MLLQEDVADESADLDQWSVGNVLDEYTEKSTGERMVRIRFTDGQEQVVCRGAVHRPMIRRPRVPRRPSPEATLRPSPPLPFEGHESSAEDSESDSSGRECTAMSDASTSSTSKGDLCTRTAPPSTRSSSPSNHVQSSVGGERTPSPHGTGVRNAELHLSSDGTISDRRMRRGREAMRHRGRLQRIATVPRGGGGSESTVSQAEYERGGGRRTTATFGGTDMNGIVEGTEGRVPQEPGIMGTQRPLRSDSVERAQRGACSRRAARGGPRTARQRARATALADSRSPSPETSDSWFNPQSVLPKRRAGKRGRGGPGIGRPKKRPCHNSRGQTVPETQAGSGTQTQAGAGTQQDVGAGTKKITDPLLSRFGPNTWKKDTYKYTNPPIPFIGPEPRCTHPYGRLPSLLGLFEKFWTPKLQRRIVRESNRYASEVVDATDGRTRGGFEWTPLGVEEFRAYLSICLLMGLKKLPCI